MADATEKLGKTVAIVAAVIAATVSANTLLTTCAQRNLDRYTGFRSAVGSEESYWKSLYDDYLTIFDESFAKDGQRRREKILALYTLAQRTPATFSEHDVSEAEKQEAARRVQIMQTRLLNSLDEQGAGDRQLKEELERRSYKGKQVANASPPAQSGGPVTVTQPAVAPAPAPPPQAGAPKPAVETLTAASATGWDVDLYWCQGQNEAGHYALARGVGDYLAATARTGRSIASGVTLGSIRVRPASVASYRRLGFPTAGRWVIWDSGPGEGDAANALIEAVNGSSVPGARGFQAIHSNGKPTRWLLSVFACPGAAAPPPRPRAAG